MVPVGDGKGLPNGSRSVGILMRSGNSIRGCLLVYDSTFELPMDEEIVDELGIICIRMSLEFVTESGDVLILLQKSLFDVT